MVDASYPFAPGGDVDDQQVHVILGPAAGALEARGRTRRAANKQAVEQQHVEVEVEVQRGYHTVVRAEVLGRDLRADPKAARGDLVGVRAELGALR